MSRFEQLIKSYAVPVVAPINGKYSNVIPNKRYINPDIQRVTEPITPQNTCILSVAAYEDDSYKKIMTFARSARKFNIFIKWLSFREQWHGFTYHKLHQTLRQIPYLLEQGYEYAFILDSFDIVFTDPLEVLCEKANKIYEAGTVLYNRELTGHSFPYKDDYWKQLILDEGIHLNAGACFGSMSAFKNVFEKALEIQADFMADQPRPGIMEYCLRDNDNFYSKMPQFITDDQLMMLFTGLYYPDLVRTDDDRYLMAWTQEHWDGVSLPEMRLKGNQSGQPNQASIIHSSVTVNNLGQQHWAKWCLDNELII